MSSQETLRQQMQQLAATNARYLLALKTIAGISTDAEGALDTVQQIAAKALADE